MRANSTTTQDRIPGNNHQMKKILAALIAVTLFAPIAEAKQPRSASAKHQFRKVNQCPTNPQTRGKCPGYVIDHIVPLCAGGADSPINMQWQTVHDAKVKDRDEVRQCRALRH